jgi:hypothetical protein
MRESQNKIRRPSTTGNLKMKRFFQQKYGASQSMVEKELRPD